jgi:hypothetical protein
MGMWSIAHSERRGRYLVDQNADKYPSLVYIEWTPFHLNVFRIENLKIKKSEGSFDVMVKRINRSRGRQQLNEGCAKSRYD